MRSASGRPSGANLAFAARMANRTYETKAGCRVLSRTLASKVREFGALLGSFERLTCSPSGQHMCAQGGGSDSVAVEQASSVAGYRVSYFAGAHVFSKASCPPAVEDSNDFEIIPPIEEEPKHTVAYFSCSPLGIFVISTPRC